MPTGQYIPYTLGNMHIALWSLIATKDSLKMKKNFKHQVFQLSLHLKPLATVFRQQDCISQQELANEIFGPQSMYVVLSNR